MKQKVVDKFPLNQHGDTEKSRSSKATRIAQSILDVEAIGLQGEHKDPTAVVSNSIDSVRLMLIPRICFREAQNLSVDSVGEDAIHQQNPVIEYGILARLFLVMASSSYGFS
ncbi:uncharacterized protein LOC115678107 isoform X1 [Syzygium oleosum]|uniref:uncharacterized protein LOC115678107 isoform X1 n=1 Tax=Syzygium oleosum TaxID=219896 RepID=UPI0011D1DECA|nr:uncharacterized protein LOC115678107 isoform X1 [Syzygium oleosum]